MKKIVVIALLVITGVGMSLSSDAGDISGNNAKIKPSARTFTISLTINCAAAQLNCVPAEMTGTDWIELKNAYYNSLPFFVKPATFDTVFNSAMEQNQISFYTESGIVKSSANLFFYTNLIMPGGGDGTTGYPPCLFNGVCR